MHIWNEKVDWNWYAISGALASTEHTPHRQGIEGMTGSLGVLFALLLPAAMALQYIAHDEKVGLLHSA